MGQPNKATLLIMLPWRWGVRSQEEQKRRPMRVEVTRKLPAAQLTRMSRRPSCAAASATQRSQSAALRTSPCMCAISASWEMRNSGVASCHGCNANDDNHAHSHSWHAPSAVQYLDHHDARLHMMPSAWVSREAQCACLQPNGADALLLQACHCLIKHLLPAPADGHCRPMQPCTGKTGSRHANPSSTSGVAPVVHLALT
jgi:hypothetical protein